MTRAEYDKIYEIMENMIRKEREYANEYINNNPQDKNWRIGLMNERISALQKEWLEIAKEFKGKLEECKC